MSKQSLRRDSSRRSSLRRWIGKAAQIGRVITGRQSAARGLTVYPDDAYIVSYPRSGNNWLRFLIGNLIDPENPVTFANLEERVPEIYFNSDRRLRRLGTCRVLKSHEVFDPRYRAVIYLVRDPRDVAVSNYHHNMAVGNIPEGYPLDEFVPRFIDGQFDRKWGSWRDHVLSWIATRQNHPGFVLIRYEDLKINPSGELQRIAALLSQHWNKPIGRSAEDWNRAVRMSSVQRMKKLEQEQGRRWLRRHVDRGKQPYVAVRSAKYGAWRETLAPLSIVQIESAFGDVMRTLGYLESADPHPHAARAITGVAAEEVL